MRNQARIEALLRGFADGLREPANPRTASPIPNAWVVAGEHAGAYSVGLTYGRDMAADADRTELTVGDYVDSALEEVVGD